jgi:two-component system NtrC family sensor kinase
LREEIYLKQGFSLITKITLITSLILIGFMVLLDQINNRHSRNAMLHFAVSNADQVAEIINHSTYNAMMRNDKENLNEMIKQIGLSNTIKHIRLVDKSGKVFYSSTKTEVGRVLDKKAEACSMCHESDNSPRQQASSMNRSRIFTDVDGKEVLGFTKAIYNQPSCVAAACHFHPQSHRILGVLDIVVSLEEMNNESDIYRMQFFIFTCFLLVFIGILINFLIQQMVNAPVKLLVRHTHQVAAGNLDGKVSAVSHDELGELSDSVNMMTSSLKEAHEELREWGSSLEQKVEERTREIKQIEQHLLRSEKLASLGKLVAGIAHEINNPLTGVLLYSSIINSDRRLSSELKPDIEKVISESRRCADIVCRLLEFSREATPHQEAIELNFLIDKVLDLMHKQPSFHNISIEKKYAATLPNVLADPGQIQQVFINIILNASQAMSENGGVLAVSTSLSADHAFVCAEVSDTGCGMSEENLNHIFDPFYTTRSDGTGLGLSISYGIVENNGGKIEVKSRLGVGTTFSVLLPVHTC